VSLYDLLGDYPAQSHQFDAIALYLLDKTVQRYGAGSIWNQFHRLLLEDDSTRLSEESQVDGATGWSVFAGIVEQISDGCCKSAGSAHKFTTAIANGDKT